MFTPYIFTPYFLKLLSLLLTSSHLSPFAPYVFSPCIVSLSLPLCVSFSVSSLNRRQWQWQRDSTTCSPLARNRGHVWENWRKITSLKRPMQLFRTKCGSSVKTLTDNCDFRASDAFFQAKSLYCVRRLSFARRVVLCKSVRRCVCVSARVCGKVSE